MHRYHRTKDLQGSRPCFTTLEPTLEGFRGSVVFEDSELCWVRAFAARDYLQVSLRSQLSQGVDSPEVLRDVLKRQAKLESWQSDFGGWLRRKGRFYRVGARLCVDAAGVQYLRLYLRPESAKSSFLPEVVRE
jgi:hypothetical protein